MGQKLHNRIDIWKKLLLDFGKRNRLINFLEGKRSNVKITAPTFSKLWELVVVNEKELIFPYAKKVKIDEEGEEIFETIIHGDIETSKSIGELQKTLKALRYRANTSIEEQGINTLFLTFGMLKWKEQDDSDQTFLSPIILVPVKLLIESITSPYKLALHDDEIVVNPTLSHKLDNDFGIKIPTFDSANDSPIEYLAKLARKVKNKDWSVEDSIHLTNLSFLKINMYKDLERNEDKLNENSIIATLVGEQDSIEIPADLKDFDHDRLIRPIDTFQVVDADSSQQDAILLSKKGASFVLQGPPGTGKSQTITNIIAEAIADGKKVLFVSEKMAALQVVYDRLTKVGLADFCFTLHSHKAKKKDILRDLANSINIDRTRVREEALAQLDILEKKRNTLNEYQDELHTPTSALNVSIFTVNGRIAKLKNAPDVMFSESKVDSVTNATLNDRVYLLNELSKTIGKRSEDYSDNVWRGANIKSLTNALRHDIDSNVALVVPQLTDLAHKHLSICSLLGIDVAPTLIGLETLKGILSLVSKSPIIPVEWVTNYDVSDLIDKSLVYQKLVERIIHTTKDLQNKYGNGIFELDVEKVKVQLCSRMEQLQTLLNNDDCNFISLNINKYNENITSGTKEINSLFGEASKIASKLGVSTPKTISELILLINTVKSLADILNVSPTQTWFESDELCRIKSEFESTRSLHDSVVDMTTQILSRFDKEILSLDFYPILQRFRGEYQTIFKFLKSNYRHDIKQLSAYLTQGGKLSYKDALSVLNQLKVLSDQQEIINSRSQQYSNDYGKYYVGVNTQWDSLLNGLEIFSQAIVHLNEVTPQLINLITHKQLPVTDIAHFNTLSQSCNIAELFVEVVSVLKKNFDKDSQWDDVQKHLEDFCYIASDFISVYQTLMKLRKSTCCYDGVISDLDLLMSLNISNEELSKQKDVIYSLYKDYYNGIETDWDKLIGALKYAGELREMVSLHCLSEDFIKSVCTNTDVISYCQEEYNSLSQQQKSLLKNVQWFTSLFEDSTCFYQCTMLDLADRMSLCKDKKNLLEEWVDYRSNRENCVKAGLGEYVHNAEELCVKSEYIVDAYLKRFYRLWLDAVLPMFPAVQSFRSRTQTQTINEFRELDKGQFKIAQARVRERALSRIPDFNSISGARDEIGVLKREINKQRRIMPLRKLFMAIPNLITSLRPCFMMSPLSVSVFLEAKSYNFDMVIFDEASQVHTEDAIGAIMRGKQVIIVGDTQQLPPTSFFSTSLNDDEFDVDADETSADYEAGAYESILEEASTILPERSLRWHYRSRHEHLIAFSNIKIYNGQLITFPSSVETSPDSGVEYIHVRDGVYDRSGKRNNIIEAKRVADLVYEHFMKYPKRSLGVVTFSEAQQNAVDAAIRQKRLQNPTFDKFFIEDAEEPFFIKNLENVQGDERDTIIFSIGYAKDNKGIMYMNFGPLSREGGYRRLNVAITRAKHNVKLVGSIVPTDIDLEKVSSEGVKMLRSYIEFAQQGIVALDKELKYNYDLTFDSPFEEAVYDFLQSKGYNVVTQVGCSGFRIDMAIKHPKHNGEFAIGIECDGATYHNSRTARERDRLRQTVLEDMGWTIYRIWSTDWIKDQKSEEEKLVKAIEKSLGNILNSDDVDSDDSTHTPIAVVEIEEKVENFECQSYDVNFVEYQYADIQELSKLPVSYAVYKVIETEQPIHIDELCRRVAPFYDRQKATSYVVDEVNRLLKREISSKIEVDNKFFISTKGFNNVVARRATDPIRKIEYISPKEIAEALQQVIAHSFGFTPEDLLLETANKLGYKRTTANISYYIEKVYKSMLKKNIVKEVDGKVHIIS